MKALSDVDVCSQNMTSFCCLGGLIRVFKEPFLFFYSRYQCYSLLQQLSEGYYMQMNDMV